MTTRISQTMHCTQIRACDGIFQIYSLKQHYTVLKTIFPLILDKTRYQYLQQAYPVN